jgi:[glutamine synthetase] adenylyltransferase / [glutamine synthetase]-adenylyl-L-tyrosine phosphorylase
MSLARPGPASADLAGEGTMVSATLANGHGSGETDGSVPMHPPMALAAHSRFVARVRRRWEPWLGTLASGPVTRANISALIDALQPHCPTLDSTLRIARNLVIERLVVLDVERAAPLDVVTHAMTALAEETLERALAQALLEADTRFGVPRNADGERIDFWILGMGKLGARELNVSSDVDLIYVYEDDGDTDGIAPITAVTAASQGSAAPCKTTSAHEYFATVARRLQSLIGDTTDDGFVFRVDLALRPNGQSGAPVVSLAALETYFLTQGREWERFAWLKSRVVAPAASIASGRAKPLRALVTHFVYRRYLDYGVFEGLRQLHRKIRDEAQRRAAGRPERANDVKLSRGGIREIEFIVQLLLVVRGGQFPEIRTRSTLSGLQRLTARGLMKPDTADQLAQAYTWLRRVEHRIQYLDDQQTHQLPQDDADLQWIANALLPLTSTPVVRSESGKPAACALLQQLGATREFVAMEFDALLHDGSAQGDANACTGCGGEAALVDQDPFLDGLPPALQARVRPWVQHPKVRTLRDESKQRLARLVQRLADGIHKATPNGEASIDSPNPTQNGTPKGTLKGTSDTAAIDGALRFVDWLEPLLRRDSYLALLVERPAVQARLVRLLGMARWPMRYLMQHPGVIDELADERLLHGRFDRDAFAADLHARHQAWQRAGEADEESLLDTLRHAHHAEVFRTLVRDVEDHLTVEQVADDLSCLADVTLDCCIRWAWGHFKQRHRDEPQLAVIAYGKLGGKELGYGSDLDVVFLYDDPDERAAEVYSAFVRKLITWLTLRTAHGDLFDIDTALRPNGNSGLLVTSMDAFARYQSGRGGNTAWTWEHQAITRARWCAGSPALTARFDDVRRDVLCAPRDPLSLQGEIRAMRDKVLAAQRSALADGRFDVKLSPGGMMDAEFAVQLLVLTHAAAHPELQANVGNIALLQRAEDAGLLPKGQGSAAADAYRVLRAAQHQARLDEQATAFDLNAAPNLKTEGLGEARDAVLALWRTVVLTPPMTHA